MKTLLFLILLIAFIACSAWNQAEQSIRKLEIIAVDSTSDHFVFKTINESGKQVTVLAEKEKLVACHPFKRFIIEDSVHQTSTLKSGAKKDIVGLYLNSIDGIKIRDKGELVKILESCGCFIED